MSGNDNKGCGCLVWMIVLVVAFLGAAVWQNRKKERGEELAVLRAADVTALHLRDVLDPKAPKPTSAAEKQESFWPAGEAALSPSGYMMSDKFIPLRALARRPNASLFRSETLEYPAGVVGVMPPWQPYYVFRRAKVITKGGDQEEKRAMWIGVDSNTPAADRKWVNEDDCFCWTTRECINIETPLPIYPTREAAEANANPRESNYVFRYADHFESGQTGRSEQSFRMSSLPVLRREEGGYWCFVRPEGTEQGYQVCWLKWDGSSPGVTCRIRTSRREFEEYLASVRQLMIDYRNPEKANAAKQDLYVTALRNLAHSGDAAPNSSLPVIKSQQQGIPKLTGFLEMPIESPLQYENVSKRVLQLLDLSDRDIWDINELAFIQADELP